MERRDLLAYVLIGLGGLALVGRWADGAGWLWLAVAAFALLAAYASQRQYGFLLIGGVLAGSAAGILLQRQFPSLDGIFLIALGAGLYAVDLVEQREPPWARRLGVVLAVLGLVLVITTSGVLASVWFALLLLVAGVLLLWYRREARAFPPPARPTVVPPTPTAAEPPGPPTATAEGADDGTDSTQT